MKHYFGYKSDGSITSVEIYKGGWPDCACCDHTGEVCYGLAGHDCQMPSVVSLRKQRIENDEVVGFVLYDCDCPKEGKTCNGCFNDFVADHFIDVKSASPVKKKLVDLLINGNIVVPGSVVDLTPGDRCYLVVASPDSRDGEKVKVVIPPGGADITAQAGEFELIINNGRTAAIELVAPAQGMRGMLLIGSNYIKAQQLIIRGWAI